MGKLTFVLFFMFIFCEQRKKVLETTELPSQVVDNFSMWETLSGKKRYFVKGEKAYYYEKKNKIYLKGVDITFYDEKERISSTVISDSGVIDIRYGDLLAVGNVVVKTHDTTFLYTDSIVWLNKKREIVTDAFVKIVSKAGILQGKGLIADADLEKIEIKGEVRGTTKVEIEK